MEANAIYNILQVKRYYLLVGNAIVSYTIINA